MNGVYYIGYPGKSKGPGYRFYCSNHRKRIVEIRNAIFIENGEISGNDKPREVVFQEVRVQAPLPITLKEMVFI